MKIERKNITSQTNQETVKFEINNEDGHLYSVLSELYSDPIGSTIREICTNCIDAHIMSHNEERPFLIKLPNPDKGINEIAIRDYGPGLDHEAVMNIYRVYGKSTKSDNNNVTGCLGLGSKSPYSVSSTFYVKSYLDGKINLYTCSMDNNGIPNISNNPVQMDTEEENGLEVIIPIYQKVDFQEILTRTLKYFRVKPLVYIQCGNIEDDKIVEIKWEKLEDKIRLTDTISVNPKLLTSQIYTNRYKMEEINSKEPEIIQLQIYYPIDKRMILNTIDRFNKSYVSINGDHLEKFMISEQRKKIIEFLLGTDFTLHSEPGKVAFSPSREQIKYTDLTLDYIIKELNTAAKILEKIILSPLKSINNSYENYFNLMVLNNEKYAFYSEFCNKLKIDIKNIYTNFSKMVFDKKANIDFLGEFNVSKEKYEEKKIPNYFDEVSIKFSDNNHYMIHDYKSLYNKKNIIGIDLFKPDIYKKLNSIMLPNTAVYTYVDLNANFKKKAIKILSELKDNLRKECLNSFEKHFDLLFSQYKNGSLSYIDLKTLSGTIISFEFDDSDVTKEYKMVKKLGMIQLEVQTSNDYITLANTLIKNARYHKSLENIDKMYLDNLGKIIKLAGLLKISHGLVHALESEVRSFIMDKQLNSLWYYFGRIITSFQTKKKYDPIKHLDTEILEELDTFFDIYAYEPLDIDTPFNMVDSKHSPEWYTRETRLKADTRSYNLLSFIGLKKYSNMFRLTQFAEYLAQKFLSEDIELLVEQFSKDTTTFFKNELKKFNLPNMDTKYIRDIDEIEVFKRAINRVPKASSLLEIQKNTNTSKISGLHRSDHVYINYSKKETLEYFSYMKNVFGLILDIVDYSIEFVDIAKKYRPIDSLHKQVIDDNDFYAAAYSTSFFTHTYENYIGKNIDFTKNTTEYKEYRKLLNEGFSVKNYNLLMSNIYTFIRKLNGILKLMKTKEPDNKMFNFLREIFDYTTTSITIPYGNRIIHALPDNFEFNKELVFLPNSNVYSVDIDDISYLSLIKYFTVDNTLFIWNDSARFNLNSKTYKNVDGFNSDFVYEDELCKLTEVTGKNIASEMKELIQHTDYITFKTLVERYNRENGTKYLVLKSEIFGEKLKKERHNLAQLTLIIARSIIPKNLNNSLPLIYNTFSSLYSYGSSKYRCVIDYNGEFKETFLGRIDVSSNYMDYATKEYYSVILKYFADKYTKSKKLNEIHQKTINNIVDRFSYTPEIKLIKLYLILALPFKEYFNIFSNGLPIDILGNDLFHKLEHDHNKFVASIKNDFKLLIGEELYKKTFTVELFNGYFAKLVEDKEASLVTYMEKYFQEESPGAYISMFYFYARYAKLFIKVEEIKQIKNIYSYVDHEIFRTLGFINKTLVDYKNNQMISYNNFLYIENFKKYKKFIKADINKEYAAEYDKFRKVMEGNSYSKLSKEKLASKIIKFFKLKELHKKINIKTRIKDSCSKPLVRIIK